MRLDDISDQIGFEYLNAWCLILTLMGGGGGGGFGIYIFVQVEQLNVHFSDRCVLQTESMELCG